MIDYHPISASDFAVIKKIMPPDARVLEVGVGHSTTQIVGICKELYCVDIDPDRLESFCKDVVATYCGDSTKFAYKFHDGFFDLVFIDGCHFYKYISSDIDTWHPRVKKGGYICGHDFESREWDERYIHLDFVKDEGSQNGRHHGVIKAVMERFPNVQHEANMWYHQCE